MKLRLFAFSGIFLFVTVCIAQKNEQSKQLVAVQRSSNLSLNDILHFKSLINIKTRRENNNDVVEKFNNEMGSRDLTKTWIEKNRKSPLHQILRILKILLHFRCSIAVNVPTASPSQILLHVDQYHIDAKNS